MTLMRRVLITGAAGNLGGKLRHHLSSCDLVLLDRASGGDPAVVEADLSAWGGWADRFAGVEAVFHFAADPTAQQAWPALVGPNVDALVNVFQAAVTRGVRRVIFASSNHVMGGYKERDEPRLLTADLPPLPGTRYVADGAERDSTPYGSAKLFGERLGRSLAEVHGLEVIAVRLGWIKPGDNPAEGIPPERGTWFRQMWLSNRDFCHLMERCLLADLPQRFLIVNGMSDNAGMRWDLSGARRVLGYEPRDGVP
jgi:NAD+ dependent glucose-6-phosphate dehydrogenase